MLYYVETSEVEREEQDGRTGYKFLAILATY